MMALFSLTTYHIQYNEFIKELSCTLPPDIMVSLEVNYPYDKLDFLVRLKCEHVSKGGHVSGPGIFCYGIGRATLEKNRSETIVGQIRGFLANHIDIDMMHQPTSDGAEEYEDIIKAQEIMDKMSP